MKRRESFRQQVAAAVHRFSGRGGGTPASLVRSFLRWRRATSWERTWRVESERPVSDLATEVPQEIVEAVASGWIPAGSSVMDIGSGRGQISAWFAERGFQVVGADIAAEATALAERHFSHLSERLAFRTLDICVAEPEAGRFGCLIDRGCFHIIPDSLCPSYVEHIAVWAAPGARLLLFCREGRAGLVHELFPPYFEIVRRAPYMYARSAGPLPRVVAPGAVFWMIRR